jgi:hypothetical protein
MSQEQFFKVEIKGVAKDAHERFPIKFDYGESGTAYFVGCKAEAVKTINGTNVTNRIDIQAFGNVAEELAGVMDGTDIHLFGEYGQKKNTKDGKYYPVVTITEVVSVG